MDNETTRELESLLQEALSYYTSKGLTAGIVLERDWEQDLKYPISTYSNLLVYANRRRYDGLNADHVFEFMAKFKSIHNL